MQHSFCSIKCDALRIKNRKQITFLQNDFILFTFRISLSKTQCIQAGRTSLTEFIWKPQRKIHSALHILPMCFTAVGFSFRSIFTVHHKYLWNTECISSFDKMREKIQMCINIGWSKVLKEKKRKSKKTRLKHAYNKIVTLGFHCD